MLIRNQKQDDEKKLPTIMIVLGAITFGFTYLTPAHGEEISNESSADGVEFDSSFLIGENAQSINTDRFKFGNPILPGEYNVDVYVNGNWYRKHRVVFKNELNNKSANAYTCFDAKTLMQFGVKKEILNFEPSNSTSTSCQRIENWVENAFYEFDSARLRLDISIPQIAMQQNAQGYIDPSAWDRGINAGFISYSASAYKTKNNSETNPEINNAFMSLATGANLGGWQLRHNGQWKWSDHEDQGRNKSSYDAVTTYVQRAFPQYRGMLTLGDYFTNGELFDSVGYRGLDFTSDERMLPNSMTGYAPRIRGNARTNAKIEIKQQGQIIYQTTVAPGSFEINDLYPTGFGGELEVSVIESDGQIQRFSVPYASVVQMLRPGMNRYSFTIGEFRDKDIDLDPWVGQAKYQHGINNYITAYTGLQFSENYQAYLVGTAFATPIGAIAIDITQSEAKFDRRKDQTGQSYRLSYSKLISPTNTNLTLAAYRYSTENFLKLRDAFLIQDLDEKGVSSGHVGKQRSEFTITLDQGLPNNLGNFYATGSWSDYWNTNQKSKQYQVGYSNTYNLLTYGLSAIKRELENNNTNMRSSDTEYMLTLSLPLTFKKSALNLSSITTQDRINVGASGTVGEKFNYGFSTSADYGNNPSFNTNVQYRTNYSTLGASYSLADQYQQMLVTARGNVVVHRDGVHFGPDQGQTMVLVYAPEASGAKVNNSTGLEINKSGYAIIPYVTPYRLNDISLNPEEMSTDVELMETSQRIAPYSGAITKVNFATKSGKAIYIKSALKDGQSLPFAAEVFNSNQESIGLVAQGGLVYVRTAALKDTLNIVWGDEPDDRCQIQYDVTAHQSENMITTEALCQ